MTQNVTTREQVRENIQTLHGFIMVLAIGNAIRQYASMHSKYLSDTAGSVVPEFDLISFSAFLFGLIMIFRFFLGDRLYIKNYVPNNSTIFILDMVNIFISAVLIAYMSFFVTNPSYLYFIASIIVFTELIWWMTRTVIKWFANRRNENNISTQANRGIKVAQYISILTIGLIIGRAYFLDIIVWENPKDIEKIFLPEHIGWISIIFFVNTFLDLIAKGPEYFGSNEAWVVKKESNS